MRQTVLYSTAIILFQIILPHRPVQESVANAYEALGGYLEAKADFFDPDEAAWIGNRHIDLAMSNTGVITAFNQCRSALFYRLRGKHRHPRTAKMLRYYFAAQDIHERISSAHVDYQEMSEKFKTPTSSSASAACSKCRDKPAATPHKPCAQAKTTFTANASDAPSKAAANRCASFQTATTVPTSAT